MQDACRQTGYTPHGRIRAGRGTIRAGCGHTMRFRLLAGVVGILAAGPVVRAADEAIVRLYPTASVTGDQVLLSDVAKLTGGAAQLAADWPVAAAPHVGDSGVIDGAHIQSVLARRGVNLSNWIFRGASRCVISRPAAVSHARPSLPAQASASNTRMRRTLPPPASQPAGVSTPAAPVPDPSTLEGAIYAHVRERLADIDGTLTLGFSPATTRLLALSRAHYQFRITDRGDKALGMIPLEVTIIEKGKLQQVVQIVCQATLRKSVVVAKRSINRGEIIEEADLSLEARDYDRLDNIGLTNPAALIGQRARRLIKAGDQLDTRDVEPVPLIERNDLVTVTVRRGGLSITAVARALSSGCYGEAVTLRSELSKETFTGVVVGPRTAELVDLADPMQPGMNPPGGER